MEKIHADEQKIKEKESKIKTKIVRVSSKAESGDLKRLLQRSIEFLEKGHAVNLMVQLERRMGTDTAGIDIVKTFATETESLASHSGIPSAVGRRLQFLMTPHNKTNTN